jgi:hypothetical protein
MCIKFVHASFIFFMPFWHYNLMPNRSCHRLLRWLKRAALRSKSKSKQRYKMFLDASASSSPSKSLMHYAHTDGGVSTIRCLDQSVDEPSDSPARAPMSVPSRSYQSLYCQNLRSPRSSQSWQNSQQPRTFEHRLLLFLLTERGRPQRGFSDLCLRALRNSRLVCPRCSHRPE